MAPGHTVTVTPSDRHVVVKLGDRVIAASTDALQLEETGIKTRWYLPEDDITVDLVDSSTSSHCPFKGDAVYKSMPDGPDDIAWSYPDPITDAAQDLPGHWSFWGDDVTIEVDGDAT